MTRICIAGGPKTGKTTLALSLAMPMHRNGCPLPALQRLADRGAKRSDCTCDPHPLNHTDDLIHLGWSEASQHVADEWLAQPGPWIIEGVAVVRALRKWREAHPGAPPPVDRVIVLWHPHAKLVTGQIAMMKADLKRWREDVGPWLLEHSVEVEERPPSGHPD